MGIHPMERRDHESADTDQAVQAVSEKARPQAPEAPQPAAHIGNAPPLRRGKYPTGTGKARTLRDRDHTEISALSDRCRCGGSEYPYQYDRGTRGSYHRHRNGAIIVKQRKEQGH